MSSYAGRRPVDRRVGAHGGTWARRSTGARASDATSSNAVAAAHNATFAKACIDGHDAMPHAATPQRQVARETRQPSVADKLTHGTVNGCATANERAR